MFTTIANVFQTDLIELVAVNAVNVDVEVDDAGGPMATLQSGDKTRKSLSSADDGSVVCPAGGEVKDVLHGARYL